MHPLLYCPCVRLETVKWSLGEVLAPEIDLDLYTTNQFR